MNDEPLQVLGVAGSLREGSLNRALMRAAQELVPAGMDIRTHELHQVPLYDFDVERRGDPPPVEALKRAIAEADALLIATPEYQHSIPGVLKNALDWASRPAGRSVMKGKPVAIMGATPGRGATARAQSDLRKVLAYSRTLVLDGPTVMIPNARAVFDDDLRLVDDSTRDVVRDTLERLQAWSRWLMRCPPPND